MKAHKYKLICTGPHKKGAISEINSKLSLCFKCSSIIFKNESGKEIFTIKPKKYYSKQETAIPLFLSIPDTHTPYTFQDKSNYLKFRKTIIKEMKKLCNFFKISKKTFFLSLDYFDKICSKITIFEKRDLLEISQFCILLAAKFHESQKAMEIKLKLGLINNYSKDELYLLQLLDYGLFVHTSYDILIDIMHTGFLFKDEKFSIKKMNYIYGKLENMLYFFAESKYYIDMTQKEIVLALIGLIRETLGLIAYNEILKNILINENTGIQNYYTCLNKLRKCFQIKDDNNHSDSNTDENSDNSSENGSEIKCQNIED